MSYLINGSTVARVESPGFRVVAGAVAAWACGGRRSPLIASVVEKGQGWDGSTGLVPEGLVDTDWGALDATAGCCCCCCGCWCWWWALVVRWWLVDAGWLGSSTSAAILSYWGTVGCPSSRNIVDTETVDRRGQGESTIVLCSHQLPLIGELFPPKVVPPISGSALYKHTRS